MTARASVPRTSPRLSRRGFLGLAPLAVGVWIPRAWASPRVFHGDDRAGLTPFEREHYPLLRLPPATRNGGKVPIVVEMDHPMDADHFIASVSVANRRDPVPSKGVFRFTPANGRVYLAFQARMEGGISEVTVTAECNRHGTWSSQRTIDIPPDAGG